MNQIKPVASKLDIEQFLFLKNAGVFNHVKLELIPDKPRLPLFCSDPFQRDDWYKHYFMSFKNRNIIVPPLMWFGGLLVLAENSPVDVCGAGNPIMAAIEKFAINHFQIKYFDPFFHTPCGAAPNLSVFQKIELALNGVKRVKNAFPQLTVATNFHIAISLREKRTYHASLTNWQTVKQKLSPTEYLIQIRA